MSKKLTKRFIKALPWTIGDALISAVYGGGMVILLGRLVSAEDVGLGGIALATSQIVEGLTSGGLQEAIIRTRSGDTEVTDTAFVLSIIGSILGFCLSVALAWPLMLIFHKDSLLSLMLVSGLILPINALGFVPTAILSRKMRASALTRRFIFGKICGMTTLLITGLTHWGPWCLVLSALAVSLGSLSSVYLGCSRWPHLKFSRNNAIALYHFGHLIAMDTFVWYGMTRSFAILFGFFHGIPALGYFQFAQRFVDEIAALLQTSFSRVGFSFFSGLDRTGTDMRGSFQLATRIITTGSSAIYVGLALIADDLVPLLFGHGWTPAVPYLRILALAWAMYFPFILTPSALKAKGRPDLLFWFGLKKGIVTLLACVATGSLSALFGVGCWAAGMILLIPWSLVQIRRHVGIPISQQINQIIPSAIAAGVLFMTFKFVNAVGDEYSSISRLAFAITLSGITYLLTIWIADPVLRGMVRSMLIRIKRPHFLPLR